MQQLIDEAVSYVWIGTAIGYSASTSNVQAVFDGGGYFLPNYFRAV
jgi:hypothetical protein